MSTKASAVVPVSLSFWRWISSLVALAWTWIGSLVALVWKWIRPLAALVAAGIWGLAGSVALATVMRPLLQWTVKLVASIASVIHSSSPELSPDAISTIDLGFGVLGGSILLATVKGTLEELRSVVTEWTTVDEKTLVSAVIATFLSFVALGLSVYGLANAKQSSDSQATLVTQPMFLTASETLGFMPIYFVNATLTEPYWGTKYLRKSDRVLVPVDTGIWAGGTTVMSDNRTTINLFLEQLRRCASRASPSNPIELRVSAYASTREFQHQRKGEHPQSEQLNIQAANDRARAVYDVLTEQRNASLKVAPPAPFSRLAQMHDARLSVDRIPKHELPKHEDLARRADITIVAAPGCKGVAQLASAS